MDTGPPATTRGVSVGPTCVAGESRGIRSRLVG